MGHRTPCYIYYLHSQNRMKMSGKLKHGIDAVTRILELEMSCQAHASSFVSSLKSRFELIEKQKQFRRSFPFVCSNFTLLYIALDTAVYYSYLCRVVFHVSFEISIPRVTPRFVFLLIFACWLYAAVPVSLSIRYLFRVSSLEADSRQEPIFASLIELISETELQICGTTLSSFTSFHQFPAGDLHDHRYFVLLIFDPGTW